MRNVTALFDAPIPARAAVRALVAAGFHPADIALAPGLPDVPAGHEALIPASAGDPGALTEALAGRGVPEPDARFYEEGVRRGAILLVVTVPTLSAPVAADIIASTLPPDPAELAAAWLAEPELRYVWARVAPPAVD